jgi:hypothetical protein
MDSYLSDEVKCEFIAKFEGVRQLPWLALRRQVQSGLQRAQCRLRVLQLHALPDYPDRNATFRAAAEIHGNDHPVVPAVRDPAASISNHRAAGLSVRDSFIQHPDRELRDWNIRF